MKISGVSACMILAIAVVAEAQILPAKYTLRRRTLLSRNGSSLTGGCSKVLTSSAGYTCLTPASSVLFDDHIPTLTELNGNMWASQLLTTKLGRLYFSFSQHPYRLQRVEIVLFNCREWDIFARAIVLQANGSAFTTIHPQVNSCNSLVRVCMQFNATFNKRHFNLKFDSVNQAHIAEITFYGGSSSCPPDTVIGMTTTLEDITTTAPSGMATTPENITTTTESANESSTTQAVDPMIIERVPSTPGDIIATSSEITTLLPLQNTTASLLLNAMPAEKNFTSTESVNITQCLFSFTSITLASVITAITTALLATLIFVLLQIALCKCRPKFTQGKPESAASAGGEKLAVYPQVDGSEKGMVGSDPIYTEIDFDFQREIKKQEGNFKYEERAFGRSP